MLSIESPLKDLLSKSEITLSSRLSVVNKVNSTKVSFAILVNLFCDKLNNRRLDSDEENLKVPRTSSSM